MKPKKNAFILFVTLILIVFNVNSQDFQGKAIYISKSKMELGSWGARLSESQKKAVAARLKNRLEKTYVLSFNNKEAIFLEEEKIDAISGATDSWGAYFTRGDHYRNIKENRIVQSQEFYGKRFIVKDSLYKVNWTFGAETKKIGNYTCYKAKAFVPVSELNWYKFFLKDHVSKKLICSNPDLTVHRGDKEEYCAGYIAKIFEDLGGEAIYYGKPYKEIYEMCFKKNEKVLAIGDNLRTDIKGANNLNKDCLFISDGVHRNEFSSNLELQKLLNKYKVKANYFQKELQW